LEENLERCGVKPGIIHHWRTIAGSGPESDDNDAGALQASSRTISMWAPIMIPPCLSIISGSKPGVGLLAADDGAPLGYSSPEFANRDWNILGKCFAINARRVGREAQMMPMLSSIIDHVAVPPLSHVMS
jgi:hypothetical protein